MENFKIIKNSALFSNIQADEVQSLLSCLSPRIQHYRKGEFIFHLQETNVPLGLVLSGMVYVMKEDFWGERTILSAVDIGEIFAEAFSAIPGKPLEVSVVAAKDTTVLLLDFNRVLHTCSNACVFHTRLVQNLIATLAGKNIMLTRKLETISKKTTRQKLLAFLSMEANKQNNSTFTIPYNRQELADYLCVERSAMSAELSKLQRDGLISYEKNRFRLYLSRESSY